MATGGRGGIGMCAPFLKHGSLSQRSQPEGKACCEVLYTTHSFTRHPSHRHFLIRHPHTFASSLGIRSSYPHILTRAPLTLTSSPGTPPTLTSSPGTPLTLTSSPETSPTLKSSPSWNSHYLPSHPHQEPLTFLPCYEAMYTHYIPLIFTPHTLTPSHPHQE